MVILPPKTKMDISHDTFGLEMLDGELLIRPMHLEYPSVEHRFGVQRIFFKILISSVPFMDVHGVRMLDGLY